MKLDGAGALVADRRVEPVKTGGTEGQTLQLPHTAAAQSHWAAKPNHDHWEKIKEVRWATPNWGMFEWGAANQPEYKAIRVVGTSHTDKNFEIAPIHGNADLLMHGYDSTTGAVHDNVHTQIQGWTAMMPVDAYFNAPGITGFEINLLRRFNGSYGGMVNAHAQNMQTWGILDTSAVVTGLQIRLPVGSHPGESIVQMYGLVDV